jgi:hypothetical protein
MGNNAMKKILFTITTSAIFFATGNLFAATTSTPVKAPEPIPPAESGYLNIGTYGLTLSTATATNPMISGKYFVQKNLAVLGGFGLVNSNSGGGTTDMYLMAGVRRYLTQYVRASDLIPFVGARYSHSSVSSAGTNEFTLAAECGMEYYLSKRLSLEGLVSGSYDSKTPSGGSAITTLSTTVYSIGANFYF